MRQLFKPDLENYFKFLSLIAIAFASFVAFRYSAQPLLEAHSFRQTQTALTALWFSSDGYRFYYHTPVGGAPWSIPFEFPIYQIIVAGLHYITEFSLEQCGRITSFFFLLMIVPTVSSIIKQLGLQRHVFYIFICLLMSSPLYIFWGRAFLIETAALFFSLLALKFFVDILIVGVSPVRSAAFAIAMSLAILQKSTTAIPIGIVIGIGVCVFFIKKLRENKKISHADSMRMWGLLVACAIPVGVGLLWIILADNIKELNALGSQMTSRASFAWNWGSFDQRHSIALWDGVVWERIIKTNAGGIIGLLILTAGFVVATDRKHTILMAVSTALFLLPMLMFTNLHIVHDYYQVAAAIFLIFMISLAVSITAQYSGRPLFALLATVAVMVANYRSFAVGYYDKMSRTFGVESRDVVVGGLLGRELAGDAQFVAFGNDWSSTFSYLSKKKSFTVPEWFHDYDKVKKEPGIYLDQGRLGAVVSCSGARFNSLELLQYSERRGWKTGATHGCAIATPERTRSREVGEVIDCEGQASLQGLGEINERSALQISGWLQFSSVLPMSNPHFYVLISFADNTGKIFETLRVPAVSQDRGKMVEMESAFGFSRLLTISKDASIERVQMLVDDGGKTFACR